MKIAVGSTNSVKVEAVKEVIIDYPALAQATVVSVAVSSEISEQPLSLADTIQGAKNRAKNAFAICPCTYAIGLESGLFEAVGAATGFFEATVCAIYDGVTFGLGLSSGFEVPPSVLERVLKQKMDLNQACYASHISENRSLGSSEGLIGFLTQGRVNRKAYTKHALVSALIHIENASLYSRPFV